MQFLLKENQRKLTLAFQSVFLWKSHENDNLRQLLCIFTRFVWLQVICCIVYCWECCILTELAMKPVSSNNLELLLAASDFCTLRPALSSTLCSKVPCISWLFHRKTDWKAKISFIVGKIAWRWPKLSQKACPISIYNNLRQKSAETWSIFDKNWCIERVLKNFTSFSWCLPDWFLTLSVFSFCLVKMILRRYSNILLLLRFKFIKKFEKTQQIFK